MADFHMVFKSSRALSIISGVISAPITFPVSPTFLAARKQSNPAPEPRSITVSPWRNEESATGFPHPRPKFAPLGTARRSFSVYPMFLAILAVTLEFPQQHGFTGM